MTPTIPPVADDEAMRTLLKPKPRCPYDEPLTVVFACGTPWTVTGKLARDIRGQRAIKRYRDSIRSQAALQNEGTADGQ